MNWGWHSAYNRPVASEGNFGKEISRDLIGRSFTRGLIGTGPRSPRRGTSYIYVTTDQFFVAFDLDSLQDLPDREELEHVGVVDEAPQVDFH